VKRETWNDLNDLDVKCYMMYKRIDAHIHTTFESELLRESAKISGVDYSLEGLEREMEENDVQYAISMGLKSKNYTLLDEEAETPMVNDSFAPGLTGGSIIIVGGINPYKAEESDLAKVEKALSSGQIKGLKIYSGYFHKYAYDDVYKRFYELAAKYNVPVILHTGDTYGKNVKVRFAHPLTMDEVAVDFRDTKFIIAHIGNPWTVDAGEVIYKNDNVYGDLSGLFLGDKDSIDNVDDRDLEDIVKAYRWVHSPDKFLYGSDWPITPMKPYIRLIERMLKEATSPEDYEHHLERVFSSNAKKLFSIE
jgi:predicted TIM-barrel fold metal-dependent hydrolase